MSQDSGISIERGDVDSGDTYQDGGVGEEEGGGVVVAGDGLGGERGEGGGGGGPEFGAELAGVVGEGDAVGLAAGDEDGAGGEDDGVGEDPGVGHWGEWVDGGWGHGGPDRDDVGVCRCVGVLLGTCE